MFGQLIIVYLFLGGLGAGILLVSSAWSLFFYHNRTRSFEDTLTFQAFRTRAYALAFVIIVFSALCLAVDLGKPERLVNLFTHPTSSVLSVGTYILSASILISGFLAFCAGLLKWRIPGAVKRTLEIVCVVVSLLLMTYTGFYLYTIKAVPFWDTPLVPVLFVLSAISSGISAVMLVSAFGRTTPMMGVGTTRAHAIHVLVIGLEIVALIMYLVIMAGDPFAVPSVRLLFGPELRWWFILGVAILGLLVPLVSELDCMVRRYPSSVLLVDVFLLAGSYCLRYCIVAAGLH